LDREWDVDLLKTAQSEVALVRSSLSRSDVSPSDLLIKDLVNAVANNLNTPFALKRLVEWAQDSHANPSVNESGLVSRAIDSLLGLAL
jgi:L-cysteine:1D-myo-inositol 2-amino-2-deoxy-alpha-D-glucopyranoside ligase